MSEKVRWAYFDDDSVCPVCGCRDIRDQLVEKKCFKCGWTKSIDVTGATTGK